MERAIFINQKSAERFAQTAIAALRGQIKRARVYPLFRRNALQGYIVILNGTPALECDVNAIIG